VESLGHDLPPAVEALILSPVLDTPRHLPQRVGNFLWCGIGFHYVENESAILEVINLTGMRTGQEKAEFLADIEQYFRTF
jgi:hypothetical protein